MSPRGRQPALDRHPIHMLYAIGDIHGDLEKLDELLESMPLEPGDRLVFLGDYIDRGPDPVGVIDRLIELRARYECVFLLGNHESMFLDFLGWTDDAYFGGDAFLLNGGDRTLAGYRYFDREETHRESFRLPKAHEDFLLGLVLSHVDGDYLFVHAGLSPKTLFSGDLAYAIRKSRPEDMLWNRTSADLPHDLGVTVIYGHTPNEDFAVRWNCPFSIGVDTGAVYGGPLTAIRLPDETIFQV
jgi:serine/threonine protein phosphatase 1